MIKVKTMAKTESSQWKNIQEEINDKCKRKKKGTSDRTEGKNETEAGEMPSESEWGLVKQLLVFRHQGKTDDLGKESDR